MSAVTLAVIHSSLPAFLQALIIAAVSASITGYAMIRSAKISSRDTEKVTEGQKELAKHIGDIKSAVGADKRKRDSPDL